MNDLQILIYILVAIAAIGYFAGILYAIYYTIKKQPRKMPSFLEKVVTAISGVLATNLGTVLGINIKTAESSGFAEKIFFSEFVQDTPTALQAGSAYLYIFGLFIALVGWAFSKFEEDPKVVVVTLPQLTLTLLGVVIGVLTAALGH